MWLSNSSIGRKVVMSVTGIALVLFLTFHMAMNLVALFSEDAYNMICEFLGANWYALVATAGLAALFVIHIIYAFWLTMQNRAARGSERYAVNVKHGGGGIMPDYFVPIDTTLYTKYHRQLRDKGALMKAHFHFIDAHRKEWLGKYKTFNEFYKRFEVTPDMLAQLVATGKEMGVEYNEEEYQKALPLLKLQMKALIARDLWDMNEYFQVMNATNKSVERALEILNDKEYEKILK